MGQQLLCIINTTGPNRYTTLYGCCYDVKTLKWRCNNVVLTSCADWSVLYVWLDGKSEHYNLILYYKLKYVPNQFTPCKIYKIISMGQQPLSTINTASVSNLMWSILLSVGLDVKSEHFNLILYYGLNYVPNQFTSCKMYS